jgi:hypothetical protein
MSRKILFYSIVILALVFGGQTRIGFAQENTNASKPSAQTESVEDAGTKWKPVEAYHLDFAINEFDDGKKINSRQYSTNLNSNDSSEIKIGTRVPVEEGEGKFEYLDVGTNISARIVEQRGQTVLTVRADISNFAVPEQGEKRDSHPILRQFRIGGATLLPLGKPMIIGSVDDPNSKRQYQLEVTVTKLK